MTGIQTARRGTRRSVAVALGLIVGGIGQYGFLAITARALGPVADAPFATFWSLLFVTAPGFLAPIEQAIARGIAARMARGQGDRQVVIRTGLIGAGVSAVVIAASAAAAYPITNRLFGGDTLILLAFMAGMATYAGQFITRGVLAGHARFRGYGLLLGSEGVLRVGLCAALAALGVRSPGAYALALIAGSAAATAAVSVGCRGLARPGPPSSSSEAAAALLMLVAASVFLQFLVSIGPVAVQLLASPDQRAAASRFLSARIIAFVPLFLLPAILAPLLPLLAGLAAAGHMTTFRTVLRQRVTLALVVGAATIAGVGVLGPWAARVVFGAGFDLGHFDFLLLAVASAGFLLCQILGAAVIAMKGYRNVAVAWVIGAITFVVISGVVHPLFLRVETGLVAGAVASTASMAVFLRAHMRGAIVRADDPLTRFP